MTNNKQQTAVEWLMKEMSKTYIFNQDDFDMFKQAKQMEKQQHKNTWTDSRLRGDLYQNQIFYYESFNDYFKLEYEGKDGK
jgi:hypothetical protein